MAVRLDKSGAHRVTYERNKKRLLATQSTCGICGQTINKSLKPPDPMSPCVDHIVPISKGGHPSDIENLQLAHWTCNRQKSDKLYKDRQPVQKIGNRCLPLSFNWANYGK